MDSPSPEQPHDAPRKKPARSKKGRGAPHGRPERKGGKSQRSGLRRSTEHLSLQKIGDNRYEFVMPHRALERDLDLEEVREMIAGDELDIARDELLYLVSDCAGFIEAHNLLGELALEDNDIPLARGHFGFAYETALEALPPGFQGRLPASNRNNAHFFLAGRGVARCLISQGDTAAGRDVLQNLARLDPADPDVQAMLQELPELEQRRRDKAALSAGDLPLVELKPLPPRD